VPPHTVKQIVPSLASMVKSSTRYSMHANAIIIGTQTQESVAQQVYGRSQEANVPRRPRVGMMIASVHGYNTIVWLVAMIAMARIIGTRKILRIKMFENGA